MKVLSHHTWLVMVVALLLNMVACRNGALPNRQNNETDSLSIAAEKEVEMAAEAGEIKLTIELADSFVNQNLLSSIRADFYKAMAYNRQGDDPKTALEFVGESIDYFKDRMLLIYTDGLNEAENGQQEQFGEERILELMKQTQSASAQQVIETLADAVSQHRNGAEPNDDLTMMCVNLRKHGVGDEQKA